MVTDLDAILARSGGAAGRAQLLGAMTRAQLDNEVRRGRLVAVFPRAYCRPWEVDLPDVRRRAALLSVGGAVALSHTTALDVYGLPGASDTIVHITTSTRRHPLSESPELLVHRTRIRTAILRRNGLPVVPLEVAVVTSWPMLSVTDRRAPAIEAVRSGRSTPAALRAALEPRIGLPGRTAQLRLAGLLAAGCESELEIWGHEQVFDVSGLDHAEPRLWLRTSIGRVRLDRGYRAERVAVELDGWRFHRSRERRERDMRRDAALAAIDWVTLRFSHERLHGDVAGCRRDVLATLAARRRRAHECVARLQ